MYYSLVLEKQSWTQSIFKQSGRHCGNNFGGSLKNRVLECKGRVEDVTASLQGLWEPRRQARLCSAGSRWAKEMGITGRMVILAAYAIKHAASCEELSVSYTGKNISFSWAQTIRIFLLASFSQSDLCHNHRIVGVQWDLWRSPSPAQLLKQIAYSKQVWICSEEIPPPLWAACARALTDTLTIKNFFLTFSWNFLGSSDNWDKIVIAGILILE